MPEAYIYDHVRTPRGRGKADGALHEVTALALATAPLKALKERNHLKPGSIDDVVLGVKAIDKEGHESLVSPYVDLPFVRRPIGLVTDDDSSNPDDK